MLSLREQQTDKQTDKDVDSIIAYSPAFASGSLIIRPIRLILLRTWAVSGTEGRGLRRQTEIADITAQGACVNHGVVELALGTHLTEHPATAAGHHQRRYHDPREQATTKQTHSTSTADRRHLPDNYKRLLRTINDTCKHTKPDNFSSSVELKGKGKS